MSEIARAWERIEAWYAAQDAADRLRPGATPEQITALEGFLGFALPAELDESLRRHDGSSEGGWPTGTLLGTAGIQSEADTWRDLLGRGVFAGNADHDASEGRDEIRRGWWAHGWIPLDADGAGNGAAIDTTPGPAGRAGQVIDMDHEVGPSGPQHPTLAAYLHAIADRLDAGELVMDAGELTEAPGN